MVFDETKAFLRFFLPDQNHVEQILVETENPARDQPLSIDIDLKAPAVGDIKSKVEQWMSGNEDPLEDWIKKPSNYIDQLGLNIMIEPVADKPIQLFVGITKFESIDDWKLNTYTGRIIFKKDVWDFLSNDATFQLDYTPQDPVTGQSRVQATGGFNFEW